MFAPQNPVPSQAADSLQPMPTSYDASKSLRSPQVEVGGVRKRPDTTDSEADRDLLSEAHERFAKCTEFESEWRKKATEELNFVDGLEHWTADQRSERVGRPCLTFDRIGPSVDQVVNNMRQNPPEPRISPVGSGADEEEADIIQGILRNIEQDSSAEIAYTTAYEHAVKIGRGWWREHFDWESEDSFEQKLVIKRIANPFSVYPDPAAEEFDYSDMRFCFVTEDLDRGVFEDLYGENLTSSVAGGTFEGFSNAVRNEWFPKGAVRVAEYWWVETIKHTIYMLSNGVVVKDIKDIPIPGENGFDVPRVVGHRKVERRKICGAKITGAEILERWEWKGKWIPLIAVIGREVISQAKRNLRGMIRPAMDANLSYDYMASKEAEAIGLAPISQWLAAKGTLEGHESRWADSNRKTLAFLEWNTKDENGEPLPQPIRINAEPAIAAVSQALAHRDGDVKTALSTWDPNLGAPGPEQSGRAINLRQRQSDNAHFHFADNLARSMRHATRVRLDLMPHVYSEERAVTIMDPDGKVRLVDINRKKLYKGVSRIFRIGEDYNPARYDVTVGTGPSYASRKAQQTDSVMQMLQSAPQPMSRTLDLVAKMIDLPPEFCDRLRPPDVAQEQDSDDSKPPQDPAMVAQMQQMGQLIQALQEQLKKTTEVIDSKRIERESAERIATLREVGANYRAEVQSKATSAQQLAKMDHDAVKHALDLRLKLLHVDQTVEDDAAQRQHDADQADKDRQASGQQAEADRQHQGDQADQDRQHEADQSDQDRAAAAEASQQQQQQQQQAAAVPQLPQQPQPDAPPVSDLAGM